MEGDWLGENIQEQGWSETSHKSSNFLRLLMIFEVIEIFFQSLFFRLSGEQVIYVKILVEVFMYSRYLTSLKRYMGSHINMQYRTSFTQKQQMATSGRNLKQQSTYIVPHLSQNIT